MADCEDDVKYPLRSETYKIIGICMEIHRRLGHGFSEALYKDAIEFEPRQAGITCERERAYNVDYKGTILPHRYFADFVVFGSVILEVKASGQGLALDQIGQTMNYLKVSGCRIRLLVNFGRMKLDYKRVIV